MKEEPTEKSWLVEQLEDQRKKQLFDQELAVLDITEYVCKLMEEQKITRKDLAAQLGWTPAKLRRFFDGVDTVVTVRNVVKVFQVLKVDFKVRTIAD